MTRQEIAKELGYTVTNVKYHWNEIKARQAKYGVYVYKKGRGEEAVYGIRLEGEEETRWDTNLR